MQSEEQETTRAAQNARQDLVYCPRAGSRRTPLVVLQQPAEQLVADKIFQAGLIDRRRRWQGSINGHILGLQAVHHLNKFSFIGPGQERQEGVNKSLHVGTMCKCLVDWDSDLALLQD
jgi:hypothetical protein